MTNIPPPHPSDHLGHPKYRPDIDGLRAVAILTVVGFHAFPAWVGAGFIGVDVFFVISGFLISTIIIGSLERGGFSFPDFYRRRIRRIFPALALVLAACFAFGWFMLLADEYRQLGKHIASGAGFVANLVLWKESGYFDNAAVTKPLLHLWSLGIEEQFYIVWPLLLWAGWKLGLRLSAIALAIAAASFALNAYLVDGHPVAAFYLPQARFWELLAGSLLAWMALRGTPFPRLRAGVEARLAKAFPALAVRGGEAVSHNIQSALGALLLVSGLIAITRDGQFPGYWALLPVMGTVLLIAAGPRAWINRVFLSNRVMVWIGLVSYPLYLWHWPLLSFARIVEGETPSLAIRLGAVLTAFVLAWLTYTLVERPLRAGGHGNAKAAALVLVMLASGLGGYSIYDREGYPFRTIQKQFDAYLETATRTNRVDECFGAPTTDDARNWYCNLGDLSTAPEYFAFGDSHALSLLPALERFARDRRVNVLFAGASGCPPLLGIHVVQNAGDLARHNCEKFNERIYEYVRDHHIGSVVLIARWTYYTGGTTRPQEIVHIYSDPSKPVSREAAAEAFRLGLRTTVERYRAIGVHVYLIGDNPQQLYNPAEAVRRHLLTGRLVNQFSVSADEHRRDQAWVTSQLGQLDADGIQPLNLGEILCGNGVCPLMSDDRFIYFDDDHLSIYGAMLVYPKLESLLSQHSQVQPAVPLTKR